MWQPDEAKNKFFELFTRAMPEGAQRGGTVPATSEAEVARLSGDGPKKTPLGAHRPRGPSFDGVDLTRDTSPAREVSFDFRDD